ncbi:MAG: zinc ribbon domain-containing protein [Armatimonadota bacterium]
MRKDMRPKCPYCGTEVPAGVRYCPWCEESLADAPEEQGGRAPHTAEFELPEDPEMAAEAPHLPRVRHYGRWILLVVIVYLVVIIIGTFNTRPRATVTIHPRLAFARERLQVTNEDPFPWTNVVLVINGGDAGLYQYSTGNIQAKETITVRSTDFTNEKGGGFDPKTQKIVNVSIRCNTPQGKAAWFGGLFGLREKN